MNKQITVTVTYILQNRTDADDDDRKLYRHPERPFELMDSDNFRQDFVTTIEEGEAKVHLLVEDALGLSSGIAVGSVDVETTEGK